MANKFNPEIPIQTAVLFLVFNRPDTTVQVFEAIRKAQPPRLYVAADGPRAHRKGEAEKVIKVREITAKVDWSCEIYTLFREENLGCKYAVSSAITWFFKHEEQGIILEDDCLPHQDFFYFCENLLEYYSDEERVSVITGSNYQKRRKRGEASYYFSKYPHCWGWASWRRAWKYFDGDLSFWPEWSQSNDWIAKTPDSIERSYRQKIFDRVRKGQIDSWAYPWTASIWYRGGLTATPNVNLISNIGFGSEATHTKSSSNPLANLPTFPIPMSLIIHPPDVVHEIDADRFTFEYVYKGRFRRFPLFLLWFPISIAGSVFRKIKKFFIKNE